MPRWHNAIGVAGTRGRIDFRVNFRGAEKKSVQRRQTVNFYFPTRRVGGCVEHHLQTLDLDILKVRPDIGTQTAETVYLYSSTHCPVQTSDLENVEKADDVGVVGVGENGDFRFQALLKLPAELRRWNFFDCHLVFGVSVDASPNNGERA